MFQKISKILLATIAVLLILALLVVLSPIIIPLMIFLYFQDIVFKRDFSKYLKTIEGKKIFCYNSRTSSDNYIKDNIVPELTNDIEVVYLNGKDPITKLDKKYISHALYSIKNKNGFPYLFKIKNGALIEHSINNEFYNTMNQKKDIGQLINKINSFYNTIG